VKPNPLESLYHHKILVALSFVGLASLYFWQPITQILSGNFNQNLIVDLDTEILKQDKNTELLVIHVKPSNRGGVPVEFGSKSHPGSFNLEIRKIGETTPNQWLDPSKMELVNSIDLLQKHPGGYVVEQNSGMDEVVAISLPHGKYWLKTVIEFGGDYYADQSAVVQLTNDKEK
jgi:hypothetical protein